MEFIVFSDMQYRMNHRRSYMLDSGISSWLKAQLDVTEQIFDYAYKNNIDTIFFNGDLFEDKNKIDVPVYNAVWNLYSKYRDDFTIIFNTGNHDIHTHNRGSSLVPFSEIVEVVTEPAEFNLHSHTIVRIIPYGMVPNHLGFKRGDKYDKHILFTHEHIAGLKLGPIDFVGQSNLKPSMFGDWDYVFNGHIHKPQNHGNVYNIGSPMQQDFGEAGEVKGFIYYKDGEIERIPLNYPKFITVSGFSPKLEKKIMKNDRDFFRVDIESSEVNNPIFDKYNVFHNIVRSEKREVRLKEVMSIDEELQEYINRSETQLNIDKLFSIGKEVVEECHQV